MKRLAFLTPLLLLTACLPAPDSAPLPGLPAGFGWVNDAWLATVETDRVRVERRVEISSDLAGLLRGSTAVQPTSLDAALRRAGAYWAECQTSDSLSGLAIACQYLYALPPSDVSALQPLPLPNDSFLSFLAELPVESARGVHIRSTGQVNVTGIFLMLPRSRPQYFDNGGFSIRRYSLASLSQLVITGETRLPPGSLSSSPFEPRSLAAGFLSRYLPRPSAWIALGFALASAFAAVGFVFPAGARLPLEPQPWQPDLSRIPPFLRRPIRLIVRLVNWLRRIWPRLLNLCLGIGLASLGAQTLTFAWHLAKVYDNLDDLRLLLNLLLADFPLAGIVETLLWPGWPLVAALFGALQIAIGGGLLARRETARLLVAGSGIAFLGGLILLWPHLLLAPPLVPFQLEFVLWLGASLLFAAALLARGLTHPQFRRYYGGIR